MEIILFSILPKNEQKTSALKCEFFKKSFIMNAPLCVEHLQSSLFGGFAVVHPPKSDEEMFNSQRCIHNKWAKFCKS